MIITIGLIMIMILIFDRDEHDYHVDHDDNNYLDFDEVGMTLPMAVEMDGLEGGCSGGTTD